MKWYRARFHANYDDARPIQWPPPGPFWVSGYSTDESYSVVIAFVRRKSFIKKFWPEADNIEIEEVDHPTFSSRFQKPNWWDDTRHLFVVKP